jgi:serine/threonine-protein kinase HipA
MSALFALAKDEAVGEVRRVVGVVAGWRRHFAGCGVSRGDLGLLAEQIDRPFLLGQRDDPSFR